MKGISQAGKSVDCPDPGKTAFYRGCHGEFAMNTDLNQINRQPEPVDHFVRPL